MYLASKLEIDPSQSTLIKKVKADRFFKKMLEAMTLGAVSMKQEQQTFTAVSILQQVYMGLKSINIDNIIRLAVDDYDFYLDESGEEGDLEKAMFEFTAKVDPIESELFDNIFLVLEHLKDSIKYLIEIRIARKHKIGEYPITINVNGVFPEYQLTQNETKEELTSLMSKVFVSQQIYDEFTETKYLAFQHFIDELEMAAKKYIKTDDVRKRIEVQIIRPKQRAKNIDSIRHDRFVNPVYYGYYGFDDYFFYAWLWSDLMYGNNIYANGFTLVDDLGSEIMKVGNEGFNAGYYDTLNPSMPFEPPKEGEIEYFGNNQFEDVLIDAELIEEAIGDDMEEWEDLGSGEGQ